MTTRRSVLKTGISLPAAALVAPMLAPMAARSAAAGTLALERFVYDVRFAEPYDIAQHVEHLGVPLSPIADDLMTLWYDELDLLWKDSPQPLAGVTMVEAAFVLETLAMDRGMRLVFRADHGLVENARIAHKMAGPVASLEPFTTSSPPADWQVDLAAAMSSLPLGRHDAATVEFATPHHGLSIRDVPLVSWVIAPRTALAVTLPG